MLLFNDSIRFVLFTHNFHDGFNYGQQFIEGKCFFSVLLKLNFVKLLRKSNIGKEADNVPQACSPLNKITFDHTLFPDPIILFESKGNYSLTSDPQRDQCLI